MLPALVKGNFAVCPGLMRRSKLWSRAVTVWMVTGRGDDGERLNYRGCDLYEFRGDKILNKDTYWKRVEQGERL